MALEAADAYMDIQPLHQTIGDAVVTALTAWARRELDKIDQGKSQWIEFKMAEIRIVITLNGVQCCFTCGRRLCMCIERTEFVNLNSKLVIVGMFFIMCVHS